MAGGIRRNSGEGDIAAIRTALLSMRDDDLRVRAELADLMRRGRALLAEAVKEAGAPPGLLARLEDRIRALEGLPQLYGTILDWDDGEQLSPLSIEAPEAVDERRASVGMTPLAEHVDRCRMEARAAGSRPPADPRAKDRDYQIWLRRTGWR